MESISKNQKLKLRRWVVIMFILLAVVLLLPLPVPHIKALHGQCLRHGETAKVEMRCVELRFFLFRDRIYGNWYIQVGDDGEEIRYENMPGYHITHIPEEKMAHLPSSSIVTGRVKACIMFM